MSNFEVGAALAAALFSKSYIRYAQKKTTGVFRSCRLH
jgi:hypothetical protein